MVKRVEFCILNKDQTLIQIKSSHLELLRCSEVRRKKAVEVLRFGAEKSYSVESGDTLAKLSLLLKICLFAWDIGVFWI